MSDNANIIRTLSTGTIISSLLFSKLNAAKQTEILAVAQAAKKPFVFVDSFGALSNTRKLAERLLAGEDVAMELEFNNIELTDDDRKGLELVRPLLEKLRAIKGTVKGVDLDEVFGKDADEVRKWQNGKISQYQLPHAVRTSTSGVRNLLSVQGSTIQTIGGYEMNTSVFKRHFPTLLAAINAGAEDMKVLATVRVGYENRQMKLTQNGTFVKLGCQEVPTSEVLRVGEQLGIA